MRINENLKLLIAGIIIFAIIIYSFQQGKYAKTYVAQEEQFQTPTGLQSINNYKGKFVLLYFGFLTCPEACPTTMSNVSNAFKQLSIEEQKKIVMIFVDLDPERDQLDKLKTYTEYFHPNIVPFVADLKVTRPFARYFGVDFQKVELKSAMKYTIDHSTDIVLLDQKGIIIDNIHHDLSGKLMALQFKKLINESNKKGSL